MNNSAYKEANYLIKEANLIANPNGSPRKYLNALLSAGLICNNMRSAGSTIQVDMPGGVILTVDGGTVTVMDAKETKTYRMNEAGWTEALAQCVDKMDETLEAEQALTDLREAIAGLYIEQRPEELSEEFIVTAIGIASDMHGVGFTTVRNADKLALAFPLGTIGVHVTANTMTLATERETRTFMYSGDINALIGWSALRWVAEAISAW